MRHHPSPREGAFGRCGLILPLLLGACSAQAGGGGGVSDGSVGNDAAPTAPCPADVGPARAASERCCPSFGTDACGAGLFCAALDGRTIPTCYPERSRPVGASCTAGNQCVSGGCSATQGVCQPGRGEMCTNEVGCGSAGGRRAVCTGYISTTDSSMRCNEIGDGSMCAPCETDSDCVQPADGTAHIVCNERHRCALQGTAVISSLIRPICCPGRRSSLCDNCDGTCRCRCTP